MKKLMLLACMALGQSALAQDASKTELLDCVIQQPLPGKNMTGAFLKFNHHGAPVEISRAEIESVTPVVELHSMTMKDNVMSMTPMTDLALGEGVREFKKGADHLMLMQIPENKLPKAGEKHKIKVFFVRNPNDAEPYSAECVADVKTVEAILEAQGQHGQHAHHHHHHEHAPSSKK